MAYILLVISFIMELVFSNILPNILMPLFLITSFIFIYPLFKKNNQNFFIVCTICGLFYDIITNSIFLNTICFGITSGFIILLYSYLKYNIFNSSLINLIIIIIYRIISYLLLCIIDYINFNWFKLLESIYNSIIINVLYGIILFLILILYVKMNIE